MLLLLSSFSFFQTAWPDSFKGCTGPAFYLCKGCFLYNHSLPLLKRNDGNEKSIWVQNISKIFLFFAGNITGCEPVKQTNVTSLAKFLFIIALEHAPKTLCSQCLNWNTCSSVYWVWFMIHTHKYVYLMNNLFQCMFSFSVAHQASFILVPSVKHLSFTPILCFRNDRAFYLTVTFHLWEFDFQLSKIFEILQC